MMMIRQNRRKADTLLVLLLFGVFAVCILMVLLTGADAYKRLSQRDQSGYDERTASQYLATRVRQADRLGGVRIDSFQGVDALIFAEEIEGEAYETRIYCYDGYLRELFAAADGVFYPEDGEKVLAADGLTLSCEGRLLTAELTDGEGQIRQITLYLRSGEGAAE